MQKNREVYRLSASKGRSIIQNEGEKKRQKILCYALAFLAEKHGLSTLDIKVPEMLVSYSKVEEISERYSGVGLRRSVADKCRRGRTDRLHPL